MAMDGASEQVETSAVKKESVHRRYFRLRDTLGEFHPDTLRTRGELAQRNLNRKVIHAHGRQ